MPRNQVIVKFPTLNDKGGDLSKKWYVEYYYRVPNETLPRKRRISEGLCTGDAPDRYANAKRIIEQVTVWLKSPALFTERPDEVTKVLTDDRTTRPEADRYAAYQQATKAEELIKSFLAYMDSSIAKSTMQTYKSKLHYFYVWLRDTENNCLKLNKQDAVLFFHWLAKERNLTKRSIFKYKQILHSFYQWLIDNRYVYTNPIYDIPNYGKIVDCAPVPIGKEDIERLKSVIAKKDPYLWLACEIQYYCAIRPGTELRLLRVGDVDTENMLITIRQDNAKNRHRATIPITDNLVKLIERLGIKNYSPELYVFGRYGYPSDTPVGKNTLRERFNKYRDALHLSKEIKFYSWKHTGAISMVNNGVSIWELQHHMRHNSITTTEEYIRQRASQSKTAKKYIDDL